MTFGVIGRSVIRAHGDDAQKYLHSQLSNDIASMAEGESRHSLLLEPTGRVVALLRVTRVGATEFLIDFDDAPDGTTFVETVLARLNRFRIRVKADFEVVPMSCVAFRDATPPHVDGVTVPAWWLADGDVDVLTASVVDDLGNPDEIEYRRIEVGWPSMGREIMPGETVPAATGVVGVSVSFSKGCYPGQELVERMDSRGSSAPRTLRRVTAPAGVAAGDDVMVDGDVVGVYTSVADTPGCALALVNRAVELGEVVTRPE